MNTSADLSSLYPHMAGVAADAGKLDAALREALLAKCRDSVEVKSRFFETHAGDLMRAAHLLADSFRSGGRLYTMGNGGSACDAAHIAVEFQHPVTAGRQALPAQNLTQDMAMISAVGNDVGFGEVFARQMSGLIRPGDVALGVSTSGTGDSSSGAGGVNSAAANCGAGAESAAAAGAVSTSGAPRASAKNDASAPA